jgi:hypothetical protein
VRRLERFDPRENVAEFFLPAAQGRSRIARKHHELHQQTMAFGGEAVGVQMVLAADIPEGGRVDVVVQHPRDCDIAPQVEVFIAERAQSHAEHDRVGGAAGCAQGNGQRAFVHVRERLTHLEFGAAHVFGQRRECEV